MRIAKPIARLDYVEVPSEDRVECHVLYIDGSTDVFTTDEELVAVYKKISHQVFHWPEAWFKKWPC